MTYPTLRWRTPVGWVQRIEEQPLALLSDHAHNELKAASTAQAWLLKQPGDARLVIRLAALAAEEVEHFHRVVELLYARGGQLEPVESSLYAEQLLSASARTRKNAFLDRMVVAALIEQRSCERFELLAEHLVDRELAGLYADLIECERGHNRLFVDLVREAFPGGEGEQRLEELFEVEGEVIASLPFSYRMHSGPC